MDVGDDDGDATEVNLFHPRAKTSLLMLLKCKKKYTPGFYVLQYWRVSEVL